ncbi:MAG: arginyltransferase [Proteobacteria bacterium]|nr:arginyltransferase [Pseudomonadota bacterium]
MTDQSFQFPRFFVTAPSPCPYLEGREERKVFTDLTLGDSAELNEALGRVGFRRSQSVAYRPACEGCNACVSVRVAVQEFEPNRGMRRILKRNSDLIVKAADPVASSEQYDLLNHYLVTRHGKGGMSDMGEFEYAEMVESSPVATTLIEYREPGKGKNLLKPGKLIATALTDVMSDGLSMVYSFFDPDSARASLGTFMILDHIMRTKKAGLEHVYLGYWVEGSQKMEYKTRFQPLERLSPEGWVPFERRTEPRD